MLCDIEGSMCVSRNFRAKGRRSKFLNIGAWAICGLGMAACSGWRAGPESPYRDLSGTIDAFEAVYSAQELQRCLAEPLSDRPGSAHQVCRDRISQALMAVIDVRYAIFEQGLLDTQRFTGLGATILQLGLSAGASVASGGTTQALAAASTAIGGVNEAVSREVLVNRTATALMSSMHARRNEISLRVRTGLGRTAAAYPLGVALSDLFAYYRAGTLAGATTALSEAASTQAITARQGVDSTLGIVPSVRIVPQANPGLPVPRPGATQEQRTEGRLGPPIRPDDDPSAREFANILVPRNATPEQRRVIRERMLLAMAAEGVVGVELWRLQADPARRAERQRVLLRYQALAPQADSPAPLPERPPAEDPAAKELRDILAPSGSTPAQRSVIRARMFRAMAAAGIPGGDLTDLVANPGREAERGRLLAQYRALLAGGE
ncbi:hypothetical protein EJV46_01655 [Roseococcus sp. SYP-B2431]|uniref:hypothetical protein n=1 Tax=Roseococcus sp. SYP-B2431 TaxID=2496640 RepID=UPI001039AD6E|nr:hypothetical protein [Roseococcus sp. SYP-B2431]TCH99408.1 hypothetical protein EJV46_01655 [Roseococcus sp. SYP-B2431]